MRINREARNTAKRLFLLCRKEGRLDEESIRKVVAEVVKRKPRNYVAILERLRRLVEIDVHEHSAVIETAQPLLDGGKEIQAWLLRQFGELASCEVREKPELLGGLSIRVGSTIWDDSIAGRLQELRKKF